MKTKYEGRKLENGTILLIFIMWKFWNTRFVGNLITSDSCEFYNDDVTVTTFMLGLKRLLMVEKVLLLRNDLVAVLFRLPMQWSQKIPKII